jgi:hypothetical protein
LVYIAISRGTSFGKISVYITEIGGFIEKKDGPSPRSPPLGGGLALDTKLKEKREKIRREKLFKREKRGKIER